MKSSHFGCTGESHKYNWCKVVRLAGSGTWDPDILGGGFVVSLIEHLPLHRDQLCTTQDDSNRMRTHTQGSRGELVRCCGPLPDHVFDCQIREQNVLHSTALRAYAGDVVFQLFLAVIDVSCKIMRAAQ